MKIDYLEAQVQVPVTLSELTENLMTSQGALAVTITDILNEPWWEPGVKEESPTRLVSVTGLFAGDVDQTFVASALSLLPVDTGTKFSEVRDRQWERVWMDSFKPMQFGQKLWIVPTGQTPPSPDADVVYLDPGLAFGTGTHPTTRLCLEWLDSQDLEDRFVIDFGCGSGILGIAAAVKGAARVLCIDNDPQAVESTIENARRNGVSSVVQVHESAVPGEDQGDFVVANILAGTLTQLADTVINSIAPGGRLALSGLLAEQADGVAGAYSPGMDKLERTELGEWALLSGVRRSGR